MNARINVFVDTVLDYAAVWFEEPREWRSYNEFLAFQIGRYLEHPMFGFSGDDLPMLMGKIRSDSRYRGT